MANMAVNHNLWDCPFCQTEIICVIPGQNLQVNLWPCQVVNKTQSIGNQRLTQHCPGRRASYFFSFHLCTWWFSSLQSIPGSPFSSSVMWLILSYIPLVLCHGAPHVKAGYILSIISGAPWPQHAFSVRQGIFFLDFLGVPKLAWKLNGQKQGKGMKMYLM